MMTRKDFIRIAELLAEANSTDITINRWCDFLEGQNPRFNREKFKSYCAGLRVIYNPL